jgi:uncharacterized protein (DUF1697 family)
MIETHIALIRAIGGATHAKLTMKALEAALIATGLTQTRNLLATGNLVIRSERPAEAIARSIEAILHAAGLDNRVFMRKAGELATIERDHPFPDAAAERPSRYEIVFLAEPPCADAIERLRQRCSRERIAPIGCGVAIDFGGPIAGSVLSTSVVERILGPGTARNWNTLVKLVRLAEQMSEAISDSR